MPTFSFTITPGVQPDTPEPIGELGRLWGRDICWRNGQPEVSPAGDWLLVDGRAALRQAVIHRLVTSPGEFAFRPDYGVGARLFVKARRTRANTDELKSRIQGQLLRDPRIATVEDIAIEYSDEGTLKIAVAITGRGQAQRAQPFIVATEVT